MTDERTLDQNQARPRFPTKEDKERLMYRERRATEQSQSEPSLTLTLPCKTAGKAPGPCVGAEIGPFHPGTGTPLARRGGHPGALTSSIRRTEPTSEPGAVARGTVPIADR